MPAGQPTKYRDEYSIQARKLCLLGATDKQLTEFIFEGLKNNTTSIKSMENIKIAWVEEADRRLYGEN